MNHVLENLGDRGVLPYIFTFHQLRRAQESGKTLRLPEAHLFQMLEDLFEPERVTAHGVRRTPVKLPVHREARLIVDNRLERGRVSALTLRTAKVSILPSAGLRVGHHTLIDIENVSGDRWFRFVGRVVSFDPERGCAEVDLLLSLGTEHLH